ncbi:MAG: hypothetical protein AAF517_20205, partial [Planctomycetota bacterium]
QAETDDGDILIYSDLQAPSIRDAPSRWRLLARRLADASPATHIRVIDVSLPDASNDALRLVRPPSISLSSREAVNLEARGRSSQTEVELRFLLNNRPLAIEVVPVTSGEFRHTQRLKLERSGRHLITARSPEDRLSADDVAWEFVNVVDEIRVLVVTRRSDRENRLLRALWPRASGLSAETNFVRPITRDFLPDDTTLSKFQCVVLGDAASIGAEEWSRLTEYVERGGGLLVLPGESTRTGFDVAPTLLPGRFIASHASTTVHPQNLSLSHPVLSPFRPPESGDLRLITVRSYWELRDVPADADILATLDVGAPCWIARRVGRGRILLSTFSFTGPGSDLDRTPLLPPLLDRIVRFLSSSDTTTDALRFRSRLSTPRVEYLQNGVSLGELPLERADEAWHVQLPANALPGVYDIRVSEGDIVEQRAQLARNFPAEESEISRASDQVLTTTQDLLPFEIERGEPRASPTSNSNRRQSLWQYLLSVALLFLFVELTLASAYQSRSTVTRRGSNA